MKTVDLENWEAFEGQVQNLSREYSYEKKGWISDMLFRGQADSSWKLQTTLERYPVKIEKLHDYALVLKRVKPQIETYTNRLWTIPSSTDLASIAKKPDGMLSGLPAYDFMVYLRHHGFPSPLLDWTRSPYIAAYFAFRHAHQGAASVSIYAYLEYLEQGKLVSSRSPRIITEGPYIRSHPRHYLQQSEYSFCIDGEADKPHFVCHENVFSKGKRKQDLLWKFNLPSSERTKVLRVLDRHNLNAYSLFGSEESLMETIANREMLFRESVWAAYNRS
jgi:FRG domain